MQSALQLAPTRARDKALPPEPKAIAVVTTKNQNKSTILRGPKQRSPPKAMISRRRIQASVHVSQWQLKTERAQKAMQRTALGAQSPDDHGTAVRQMMILRSKSIADVWGSCVALSGLQRP